jgi:hypothetical protein
VCDVVREFDLSFHLTVSQTRIFVLKPNL